MQVVLSIIEIIGIIGVPGLITGITLRFIARYFERKDSRDEVRANAARDESMLIMENLQAVGRLAEATALALQREGRINGDSKTALEYYARARDKTNEYLLRQNAVANH